MGVIGPAVDKKMPTATFDHDHYTVTRVMKVECNSPEDGPITAQSAPGVPNFYDNYFYGHEGLGLVYLKHIIPHFIGGAQNLWEWEIECVYDSPERKEGEGTKQVTPGQFQNPLLELCELSFSSESVQVPMFGCYDTNMPPNILAMKNSANQIYDPPILFDQVRLNATFKRNENINSPHPALSLLYCNTCNSDTWFGCAPGVVRCKTINASRQVKNLPDGTPFDYLSVTYTFAFMFPDHDIRVLDAGDYFHSSMAASKTPFLDDNKNPVKGLLDGNGGALPIPAPPANPVWVFNTFRAYARQPFAPLNLPQSFASGVQ